MAVLLQTLVETLHSLRIACEQLHERGLRDLGHAHACDCRDGDGAAVTEHIQPTREIIAALTVSNDVIVVATSGDAAHYLDKAFQDDVQVFTHGPVAIFLAEEAFAALVVFDLRL